MNKTVITYFILIVLLMIIFIPIFNKNLIGNSYKQFIFLSIFITNGHTKSNTVKSFNYGWLEGLEFNSYQRIALFGMDHLRLIGSTMKVASSIEKQGYFYGFDENNNIMWLDSSSFRLYSPKGIEIWNKSLPSNCKMGLVRQNKGYYYNKYKCFGDSGQIFNYMSKYNKMGEEIWEIDLTSKIAGNSIYDFLDVTGDNVYLMGEDTLSYFLLPVDADGNIYNRWDLGGYLIAYASANAGNDLIIFHENGGEEYLSKYQSDGELVFNVKWNGIRIDFDSFDCKKILLDEDRNIFLFGSEATLPLRMIVTKYDEDGNELWTKVLIGDYYENFINYEISDVQYRGSGEFYVIGSSDRYGWNKGVQTVIVGMDSDGNRQWIQSFHPENAQYLTPMATTLDENGDLFVAGTYSVEEEVIDNVGGCGC